MSLLRLLTAGKSLVGLKDRGHRYSVASRSLMPKFVSKKNPFRASTLPEAVTESNQELSGPAQSAHGCKDPAPEIASVAQQTRVSSEAISFGLPSARPCPAELGSAPASKSGGSVLAALFSWKRKKVERPGVPNSRKSMVQAELSLEAVKVVRNDLSDSDLEIVSAKPTVTSPPVSVDLPRPRPAPVESSWDRWAVKMFGADKT